MRHSTILTAFTAFATVLLTLPAMAGDRLADSLADETASWLDDCGHLLAAEKDSRACPFDRVTFLEDLPVPDDILDEMCAVLDTDPDSLNVIMVADFEPCG